MIQVILGRYLHAVPAVACFGQDFRDEDCSEQLGVYLKDHMLLHPHVHKEHRGLWSIILFIHRALRYWQYCFCSAAAITTITAVSEKFPYIIVSITVTTAITTGCEEFPYIIVY